MKTITNKFKIALVAVAMLAIGTVSAQRTAGADFTKGAAATLGAANGHVKVVDNKGTIKYLRSDNGVTLFTDTAPDGGIVTTWQLGGTLTDNTYITAGAGTEFALNGLELVTDITTASTDATDRSSNGTGTGFTVLLRNEATGAVQKMRLSDLLQVSAIGVEYVQSNANDPNSDASGNATQAVNIAVADLPIIDMAKSYKLFVFRNGVKLRWAAAAAKDFNGDTAAQITINWSATELPMYNGDIIEIQYIK